LSERRVDGGVLLHVCCGPCGTVTIDHWRDEGLEPVGFFFNPNIHPLLEFRRRLEGARDLARAKGVSLVEDLTYDPTLWFRRVAGENERCAACIAWRLERSAEEACRLGYSAFSTSLSISPYQDHSAIERAGLQAAAEHGVTFIYEDLRPLYRLSRDQSRRLGLYRQQYCGCVLSEWERYRELG
jgi:predicted adenine nucleotide alpha hydrolase (AANH) superfamily ATPase